MLAISERKFETFIVNNLDLIKPDITVVHKQKYLDKNHKIDLICKDKSSNYFLIELKVYLLIELKVYPHLESFRQISQYLKLAEQEFPGVTFFGDLKRKKK